MNSLKKKLSQRKLAFATTCSAIGWAGLIRYLKNDVLDFLILDLEHGHFTYETCENMLRMCNQCQLPAIVRVEDTEYHLMSKYLDMGADGILVPRVETVTQALYAVECLRFPPKGKKGCGGHALFHDGISADQFNENRLIFLQIESPKGIANLAQILQATDGEIAGIIVGPGDLSISMGIPFQYDAPQLITQVEQVFKTTTAYGLSCGIFCENDDQIHFWKEKGANIIWSGTDIGLLCRGYRSLCQVIRELE